jgi:hypothetical protein
MNFSQEKVNKVLEFFQQQIYPSLPIKEPDIGQTNVTRPATSKPLTKPLAKCKSVRVILTTYEKEDDEKILDTSVRQSIALRRKKIVNLTNEALAQGGILTKEILSILLFCDTVVEDKFIDLSLIELYDFLNFT